ncbi:MAG: acetyl-CoA carboxylase biotin carboxyl carrier protein [Holosporaceae bacterium]|nr:acetyl-CoA carboxylase biotin carboxyl carrier protein [Holosporaceae bacterium]
MSQQVKIDTEAVRALAELLRETDLTEIEYQIDSLRIKVLRAAPQAVVPVSMDSVVAASGRGAKESESKVIAETPPVELEKHPGVLAAQMVGTVYLSPGPDAKPFVSVGDTVSQGQTLFIIEAMKVMNMVKAPRPGQIKHIFVRDAQPVEYGDPIVIID